MLNEAERLSKSKMRQWCLQDLVTRELLVTWTKLVIVGTVVAKPRLL